MSFVINKINSLCEKMPASLNWLYSAPPQEADKVAQDILAQQKTAAPRPHDVKPASSTMGQAIKTGVVATTLATAAVLGGWKIAVGGYIIYQGARWIQGKHRNDEPLVIDPIEERNESENALHKPKEEPSQSAPKLPDLPPLPKTDLPPLPVSNPPSQESVKVATPPTEDAKPAKKKKEAVASAPSGMTVLTLGEAVKKAWRNNHYFLTKFYKIAALIVFWPTRWIFSKFTPDLRKPTKWATKIGKGIGAFLSFVLVFPWVVSIFELLLRREKK